MKIMRKIFGILAVLLLCAAFMGACSGAVFTVTENVAVNPSGIVSPGDKVTAKVTIEIPKNTLGITEEFSLKTDLDNAVWSIKVYQGDSKIYVTTLYTPALSGLVVISIYPLPMDINIIPIISHRYGEPVISGIHAKIP